MKTLFGRKLGMTQVFKDGKMIPVTVIEAGPCTVIDVRTPKNNGYSAIVVGYEDKKEKHTTKPLLGIFKKAKVTPKRIIREIRVDEKELDNFKIGSEIKVDIFQAGDVVDVAGKTKGRGFQGTVKRHGFRGFPDSHGHRYHRAGGSAGASASPSRVFKGKTMPGHMGNEINTTQNLKVVEVIPERNLILIKGSVSGAARGFLTIKKASKVAVKNA